MPKREPQLQRAAVLLPRAVPQRLPVRVALPLVARLRVSLGLAGVGQTLLVQRAVSRHRIGNGALRGGLDLDFHLRHRPLRPYPCGSSWPDQPKPLSTKGFRLLSQRILITWRLQVLSAAVSILHLWRAAI